MIAHGQEFRYGEFKQGDVMFSRTFDPALVYVNLGARSRIYVETDALPEFARSSFTIADFEKFNVLQDGNMSDWALVDADVAALHRHIRGYVERNFGL